MEILRSRQNPFIKQLIKLAENRRERQKTQSTILLGLHLIEAALVNKQPLSKVLICEGFESQAAIVDLIERFQLRPLLCDRELFLEIENLESSAGILAQFDYPAAPEPCTQGFCLLLESIQDPGNVGSILRSAAGAGIDQVWLSTGCADVWSPKVLRAAMGAHFVLPIIDHFSFEHLADFQGKVFSTRLDDAQSLYKQDLTGSLVLALGNEGAGISDELQAYAHSSLFIPLLKSQESLNVAAAAAICLYESVRQRLS